MNAPTVVDARPAPGPRQSSPACPTGSIRTRANQGDEQRRIFEGPTWSFLCLAADIPAPGDYRTTYLGRMPAIVVRTPEGGIKRVRESLRPSRRADRVRRRRQRQGRLPLHLPRLELRLRRQPEGHRLRARLQRPGRHGAGLPQGQRRPAPAARDGAERPGVRHPCRRTRPRSRIISARRFLGRLRRVLKQPIRIMGRFTQALPNNWKLYVENVKDTYHASLLHLFFGTFRITPPDPGRRRAGQPRMAGTMPATPWTWRGRGQHGLSRPGHPQRERRLPAAGSEPARHRRRVQRRHQAADPRGVPPASFLQQIHNCLAVRQVLPKGIDHDGAALDLFRLRRRHAGHEPPPPEAAEPGRAGRLRVDGGWLRRRLRAARHRHPPATLESVF